MLVDAWGGMALIGWVRYRLGVWGLFLSVLVMALAPLSTMAQTSPVEWPAVVGSLSSLDGDVTWYDRDSGVWIGSSQQLSRNWPLVAGDRLRTGPGGRAELHLGSSTVRLGADVDLTLRRLDEQALVLWLDAGTLALRLIDPLSGDKGSVELITAEGRWLPRSPGHYRFDRQPKANTPATQASVWQGELRFVGQDSALTIPAGGRADLWLDPVTGATRYAWALIETDAFANGVVREAQLVDAPGTVRYVPPGMSGWQDLERHGDWVTHPAYGVVWQPRSVAPGWAPFHDGRWAWVSPWGWTWIDAAPWGFAPFHYGAWVMWQGRWCWSPGQRNRPVRYAPAHSGWIVAPAPGPHIGYRPPPPRVVIPIILNPPPRRAAPELIRPLAPHEFDRRRDPDPRERWWPEGREPSRPAPDRPVLRPGPVAPPVLAPVVKVPAEPERRDRVESRPALPAPTPAVSPAPLVSPAPGVLPPPQVPPVQVAPRPGLSPGLNAPAPWVRPRDAAKAQEPAHVATPQRPDRAESR